MMKQKKGGNIKEAKKKLLNYLKYGKIIINH